MNVVTTIFEGVALFIIGAFCIYVAARVATRGVLRTIMERKAKDEK